MAIEEIPEKQRVRGVARWWRIAAVVGAAVAVMIGAASLPFLYESPSMYYKFGWDKTFLRAGKVIGLMAAVLLLLQLPIAGRLKWLDRLFSLPGLYRIHRINAYLIVALVVIHPVLVFLPEGRWMIPVELRYWPEWVGAGLLTALVVQTVAARWRAVFVKRYPRWLMFHRVLGMTILALLVTHVLAVSETFEHDGLPRTAVWIAAGTTGLVWLSIRLQRLWARRRPFRVVRVFPAGRDTVAIDLEPVGAGRFRYLPGQFAFFSFTASRLSREWHPFTLSSSPTRPGGLQVTIRRSGDWTRRVDALQPGDRVHIHGPFGRFSHRLAADDRDIIFIAGGIGITPMVSMLRAMRDGQDARRVTLLWSNPSADHRAHADALAAMRKELMQFETVYMFTRTKDPGGEFGRLNRKRLESLLADHPRTATVFICGPPQMIRAIRRSLITIGFHRRSIHTELFDL